jgi:carboxylesterase
MKTEKEFRLVWGNKKAILLIHGLTGGPFELRQIAKRFHSKGYDIYCPVLPGHVESLSKLKKTKWHHWQSYIEDYLRMIIDNEYNEIYIAGLCMGATLAITLAAKEEFYGRIKAIATWSIFTEPNGWSLPWYRVFLLPMIIHTPVRYFYNIKERHPYGIKNETLRKKICFLMANTQSAYDRTPAVSLLELKRLSKFLLNNIDKVKVPVLMIHSEYDDVSDIKNAEKVYNKLQCKEKSFIRLYNSYHMITIDNDKQIVIDETLKFFEKY